DCRGHRRRVADGDKCAIAPVLEDLPGAVWTIGANDGSTAGERLHQHAGQTFIDRGQDDNARTHHPGERVANVTRKDRSFGTTVAARERLERGAIGAISYNREAPTAFRWHQGHRPQNGMLVLLCR